MENLKIFKSKVLAILMSGGIALSATGCSQTQSDNVLVVDTDMINSDVFNDESIPTMTDIQETSVTMPITAETITETEVVMSNVDEGELDGNTKIVKGNIGKADKQIQVYVESGNVYINGLGCEDYTVSTDCTKSKETSATTQAPVTTTQTPAVTTAPVTTAQAPVVTTAPVTTTQAPVVTTAPVTTTQAPVVTTAPVTTQAQTGIYSYQEMTIQVYEELCEKLLAELNRNGVYKAANKKFSIKDMYAFVYIINIDFISDELKQTLIENHYIADDVESLFVDAFIVKDALSTHNLTRLKWNTNIDEMTFAMTYLKDDPTVYSELIDDEKVDIEISSNSTNRVNNNVTDKIAKLDSNDYYTARDEFYSKYNINDTVSGKVYNFNDFVDTSVAIYDQEAKENVQESLRLSVDASIDNSKAYKTLKNFYFYGIENNSGTTLVNCGAGANYAIGINIVNYMYFMSADRTLDEYAGEKYIPGNEYKSFRGFTANNKEYKQGLTMDRTLADCVSDISNVVRIHEGCDKSLTK